MVSANYYLDAMGITEWVTRNEPIQPSTLVLNRSTDWLIIMDAYERQDDQYNSEIKLLDAILSAVKLDKSQPSLCNEFTSHKELISFIETVSPQVTMIMGESAARRVLKSRKPLEGLRQDKAIKMEGVEAKILVTYSLKELLAKPELKRNTWQDLKGLMPAKS